MNGTFRMCSVSCVTQVSIDQNYMHNNIVAHTCIARVVVSSAINFFIVAANSIIGIARTFPAAIL